MARPNKPYLAGTITIPTATDDYAVLENIFAAEVVANEVGDWRDLIVGVANVILFTFNKQITVKYGTRNADGLIVAGDPAVWRNPTPSTMYRSFNDIQRRENHTFYLDELYVTNASGSDVTIDVEIFANNNGPFLN